MNRHIGGFNKDTFGWFTRETSKLKIFIRLLL